MSSNREIISKGFYNYPQTSGLMSVKNYIFLKQDGRKCLLLRFVNELEYTVDFMAFTVIQMDATGAVIKESKIVKDKLNIAAGGTFNHRWAIVVDDFCTDFRVVLTEVRSGRYCYRPSNGLVDTTYIKAESFALPSERENLIYSDFSVSPKRFGKRGWTSFFVILAAIVMAGAVLYGVYGDYFAVKRKDAGLLSWLTQLSAEEVTVFADDLAAEETVTVL